MEAAIVKLTIKLPEGLRRRAKAAAALRGETVSEVVRAALEAYVSEVMEETERSELRHSTSDVGTVEEIEARVAAGADEDIG